MTKQQIATAVAMASYSRHTPYIWGGDNWLKGLDCSGFVGHILREVDVMAKGTDDTAQGYYNRFKGTTTPEEGCLVFYGKAPNKITHVMYCLGDGFCIGMVNGNSETETPEDAERDNAYCAIRPVGYRKDIVGYVNPFV